MLISGQNFTIPPKFKATSTLKENVIHNMYIILYIQNESDLSPSDIVLWISAHTYQVVVIPFLYYCLDTNCLNCCQQAKRNHE